MAITAVGSIQSTGTPLSVNPTTLGDVLVFVNQNNGTESNLSHLAPPSGSGGCAGAWNLLAGLLGTSYSCGIWWNTITTTGSTTIQPSVVDNQGQGAQQFTAGAGMTWSADGAGATAQGTAGSGTLPSVTPSGANELYLGTIQMASGWNTVGDTGFTYQETAYGAFAILIYNLAASTPTAQVPTWVAASSGLYIAAAGLLTATPTGAVAEQGCSMSFL